MEKIITRFFDGANIQRWNDHVRPVELTELDKQAHKAVIAYILAKMEEI
jgi:putative hydrolase of HD superfamily